jgi:hypothetical protein
MFRGRWSGPHMLKAISIPFADVIPSPLTALMSRRGRLLFRRRSP